MCSEFFSIPMYSFNEDLSKSNKFLRNRISFWMHHRGISTVDLNCYTQGCHFVTAYLNDNTLSFKTEHEKVLLVEDFYNTCLNKLLVHLFRLVTCDYNLKTDEDIENIVLGEVDTESEDINNSDSEINS